MDRHLSEVQVHRDFTQRSQEWVLYRTLVCLVLYRNTLQPSHSEGVSVQYPVSSSEKVMSRVFYAAVFSGDLQKNTRRDFNGKLFI